MVELESLESSSKESSEFSSKMLHGRNIIHSAENRSLKLTDLCSTFQTISVTDRYFRLIYTLVKYRIVTCVPFCK